MLSFLSPLFLAGAAAAAVPIVLHLLKREPEARLKFAAVKLIKQAPVEYTDRRRLRELLLLALRVTALVLLALAFARPFLATGAAVVSTGVTVVALDTSYSLAAPGRFERAKQLAKDAVAKAHSERPGLVLADINLGEGGSGIDAVSEILNSFDIPVIFITAYPEKLLTGERPEPTYLIAKPFLPETVQATVGQALFFHPVTRKAA